MNQFYSFLILSFLFEKASSGKDKSIKIWDPETCKFIYSFEGHRDVVSVIDKI
jgi:WD40 repeat protein